MATVRYLGLFPGREKCGVPFSGVIGNDPDSLLGPGTQFEMTKDQAMFLCWRIKKWKYEFSMSKEVKTWINAFSNPPSWINPAVWTLSIEGSGEFTVPSFVGSSHVIAGKALPSKLVGLFLANNELDLASCFSQPRYALTANMDSVLAVNNFVENQTPTLSCTIDRIPHALSPTKFLAGVSVQLSGNPFPFRNLNFSGAEDLFGTFKFKDLEQQIAFRSGDYENGDPPPPPTAQSGQRGFSYERTSNFLLTISPSEYWPYDPGDGGGPIYDSATGAQLRPFPS